MRQAALGIEEVRRMQDMFSGARLQGRDTRREEGKLVEVEDTEDSKMTMTDPVADMLTRIRNANQAGHKTVEIPASKMKKSIASILKEEGYIEDYEFEDDGKQGLIRIAMKYAPGKTRVISQLRRISKPGLKVYVNANDVPRVLGGLGIAIISTSKGVISDKDARRIGVGGEVICYVW